MVPKIGERKLPLVIQCFLLIILLKQSITVERYPDCIFFMLAFNEYFDRLGYFQD
jgi:hypothetical protein